MTAPKISKLGHIGLHVFDLDKQKSFYHDVLGLTVSDEDPHRAAFMSARPDDEHHELLLVAGRETAPSTKWLQQLSFCCESYDDLTGFYRRLKEYGVKFDRIISHGNAIGVYFFDPEGNRCEVYWKTGLQAHQPYAVPVDLERPRAELLTEVEESVAQYGATGYVQR